MLVVCLAIFIVRCERAITHTSPTFDEAVHLTAGYSYWRTGDFRMNRETPPLVKLLWALPLLATDHPPFAPNRDQWEQNDIWRMGDAFLYESSFSTHELLQPARRVNVAISAMLVVLVGWWARRLWGLASGIAAWALAALDPNLIAQSSVLSTDVGLTLFCTSAAYCLWEYAGNPRRSWFILAGIALATKFSAVIAVAGLGSGAIVFVLAGGSFALPGIQPATNRRTRLKQILPAFVRLGLIAVLCILPSYFVIQGLDWPRGLRQQLGRNEFADPHYYLNGEVSTKGWWWYFPEVLALKTPAGTLLLAMFSLIFARSLSRRAVAFVIVPSAGLFLAMVAARLNIGIRVILPAYPLLWLLAGRVASFGSIPISRWMARTAVAVGILLPPVLDADLAGRDLSYFNGIIAGRADGHRYLGDSNIDWGQGLSSLGGVLREHGDPVIYLSYAGTARPEAYGIRYERLPGWGEFRPAPVDRVDANRRVFVAISVSNLQGTFLKEPKLYHWLLDRQSISRTDGSIWVFDVTGDEEALKHLQKLGKSE